MMTTEQVRDSFAAALAAPLNQSPILDKDVTRRHGWENLKPLDKLVACEKCQGLGKGGKIVKLGIITVVDVRFEPLRRMIDEPTYGLIEVRREGFPWLTPAEFVAFFCKGHKGITPDSIITRIEFAYVHESAPG